MISNRVSRLTAVGAPLFCAMMYLLFAGSAASTFAQSPAHHRVHSSAVAATPGATQVHVHVSTASQVHGSNAHGRHARAVAPHRRRSGAVHSTYARVNVNVVVQPGYPLAGPVNGAYAYPYPLVTYASGYYPYPVYPYLDLTEQGYSDGFHRGQDDAEDHRYYDPYRKGYRNPGSVTYTNGFLAGYAAGYGHY